MNNENGPGSSAIDTSAETPQTVSPGSVEVAKDQTRSAWETYRANWASPCPGSNSWGDSHGNTHYSSNCEGAGPMGH